MDNFMNVTIQIASYITALSIILGYVIKYIKRLLEKQLEPINKSIDNIDENQCKNYLVDFLSDVERGLIKSDEQKQIAYEMYDHYVKDLNKNSYIHDKWQKLMN